MFSTKILIEENAKILKYNQNWINLIFLTLVLNVFFLGLALEYTQGGDIKTKMIDLLDLSAG